MLHGLDAQAEKGPSKNTAQASNSISCSPRKDYFSAADHAGGKALGRCVASHRKKLHSSPLSKYITQDVC